MIVVKLIMPAAHHKKPYCWGKPESSSTYSQARPEGERLLNYKMFWSYRLQWNEFLKKNSIDEHEAEWFPTMKSCRMYPRLCCSSNCWFQCNMKRLICSYSVNHSKKQNVSCLISCAWSLCLIRCKNH